MALIKIPSTPNPKIGEPYSTSETKRGRAMLFQVTDPRNQPIFEYLLALHVNPHDFGESFTKSKTTAMTYGGYVEWVWPDELDAISATASTGAFMGPETGLISGWDGNRGRNSVVGTSGRHGTIAWERQQDLLDLFHNNGVIFNGQGEPVLHGNVMCIYDRGIYTGYFTSFNVDETDDKPFAFELTWEFKVLATIYQFPGSNMASSELGFLNQGAADAALQRQAAEAANAVKIQAETLGNGPSVPPSGAPGGIGQQNAVTFESR
jgi:hypothetical protein